MIFEQQTYCNASIAYLESVCYINNKVAIKPAICASDQVVLRHAQRVYSLIILMTFRAKKWGVPAEAQNSVAEENVF